MPRRSRNTPSLLLPDTQVPGYSSDGGAPPPSHSNSTTPSPMGTPPLRLQNWEEDPFSRLARVDISTRQRTAESSTSPAPSSSSRPAQPSRQQHAFQTSAQLPYPSFAHPSLPQQRYSYVPQAPRTQPYLPRHATNNIPVIPTPFSHPASPSIDYANSVYATYPLPHTGYTQPSMAHVQQQYPAGTENVHVTAPVLRRHPRRGGNDAPSAAPRRQLHDHS